MKHRTLRLYSPPNAFVCLFFQRGIGLRDAVTTLSYSSSSAAETLTSLTEACPVLLFAKTGKKIALIPHAAHSLCLFLYPYATATATRSEKMCIFNENKKKQQRFLCALHAPVVHFFVLTCFRLTFFVRRPLRNNLFWRDVLVAVAIVFALGP